MPRKSLRPHLNQIRAWVRQGRTDAWVAHQLEVTVRDIEQFKRQNELVSDDEAPEGTGAGDYHDYFTVKVNPELPLISSRQVLFGKSGEGDFITNATSCPGDDTTYVTLKDTSGETTRKSFTTPIGLEGCKSLEFKPTFKLESGSSESDAPNPFTTEVIQPASALPTERAPSQVVLLDLLGREAAREEIA